MLSPKNRRLKWYKCCFYGREFDQKMNPKLLKLNSAVKQFLDAHSMEFHPDIRPGEWLWPELKKAMSRSAFCIFETVTRNTNVHIELGYALANKLYVTLLIEEGTEKNEEITKNLPSNLAGLIQVRYPMEKECEVADILETKIPKIWWSVEDRLGPLLRHASMLDQEYFQLLRQAPPAKTIEFTNLVTWAKSIVPESSIDNLASFLCQYDEALIIEGITPQNNLSIDSTAWQVAPIHWKIRVDPEYRDWIAKTLG